MRRVGSYWQLSARIGEAAIPGPLRSHLDDPEHEAPEEDDAFFAAPSISEAPDGGEEGAGSEPEQRQNYGESVAEHDGTSPARSAFTLSRKPARTQVYNQAHILAYLQHIISRATCILNIHSTLYKKFIYL